MAKEANAIGSASRIRREWRIILAFAASALTLFGVTRLASEIAEGELLAFDRAVLLALRRHGDPAMPIGPHWLHGAVLDLTTLGGTAILTLLTVIAVGYLFVARKHANALFLAVAIGGGAIVNSLLKIGFARPRPDLVAHLVDVSSASFPSGHAMNSAVTYLTLGAILARAQADRRTTIYILATAILLTMLVGITRIYLGVHWPSDVLAGWAVGGSWALLCWTVALKLQLHHRIEPPASNWAKRLFHTPTPSASDAETGSA